MNRALTHQRLSAKQPVDTAQASGLLGSRYDANHGRPDSLEEQLGIHPKGGNDVLFDTVLTFVEPKRDMTKIKLLDKRLANGIPSGMSTSSLLGRECGPVAIVEENFESSSSIDGP